MERWYGEQERNQCVRMRDARTPQVTVVLGGGRRRLDEPDSPVAPTQTRELRIRLARIITLVLASLATRAHRGLTMTDTEALVALERRIEAWWRDAAADLDRFEGVECPTLSSNDMDRDAESFLRGVEAGWIRVEHPNKFRSVFFGERGPTEFTFFEGGHGKPATIRDETFAHYAAATELVLDLGWRVDQVVSEAPDPCKTLSVGALDLLVFTGADRESPVLGVEAKGDRPKATKLVRGIETCGGDAGRSIRRMSTGSVWRSAIST